MMNKIFLDLCHIPSEDTAKQHVKHLKACLEMIDHEVYSGYFSREQLHAVYRAIKAVDHERATYLLNIFSDWKDYASNENANNHAPLNINGVTQLDTLATVFHQNCAHSALFTTDCVESGDSQQHLTVTDSTNAQVIGRHPVLPFHPMALYYWFVANRHPQRLFDPNYKKHSPLHEHEGKRGVVSAFKYNLDEAQQLLNHAVGSGKENAKRFIVHHSGQKRIVVFFNQNMADAYFHGYHFEEANKAEIARLDSKAIKKMRLVPFDKF